MTCQKHTYPDKKTAMTALNRRTTGRRKQRHGRPKDLRAYYCEECSGWHLTKQL